MKKVFAIVLALFMSSIIGVTAFADMGPKPSSTFYVNGVEDGREYYIMLVNPDDDPHINDIYDRPKDDAWEPLKEFCSTHGYAPHFSPVDRVYQKLSGNDTASWDYNPPDTFCVLLYFPDNESFLVSNQYKKYAFNAYFSVNVNGDNVTVDISGGAKHIVAVIAGLLLRMAITVLIEVCIAKGYGIFGKKPFRLIIIMNVITQLLLNALLWKSNYDLGSFGVMLAYPGGEILVFAVEAIFYSALLPGYTGNEIKGGRAAGYALTANLVSFVGGGVLLFVSDILSKI